MAPIRPILWFRGQFDFTIAAKLRTLNGKNSGNQLSMSFDTWSLRCGWMLIPTWLYNTCITHHMKINARVERNSYPQLQSTPPTHYHRKKSKIQNVTQPDGPLTATHPHGESKTSTPPTVHYGYSSTAAPAHPRQAAHAAGVQIPNTPGSAAHTPSSCRSRSPGPRSGCSQPGTSLHTASPSSSQTCLPGLRYTTSTRTVALGVRYMMRVLRFHRLCTYR